MIKHYSFQQLGKAKHGWLNANHHFSFGSYYNLRRMGFGSLRVINDDRIAANTGFPEHPHKNMEIISYIRTGAIYHSDSKGNEGVTSAGEVQVMSAGKGIFHAEHNSTNEAVTLFQIWIEPAENNVEPRWDSMSFSQDFHKSTLPLLVSGYPEDKGEALFIYQKARIFGGKIKQGSEIDHQITHQAYVLASAGSFELTDGKQRVIIQKGDGAEITISNHFRINALTDCEIIVIDAP